MKALINPLQSNLVVQVEPDDEIFPVTEPLYWFTCPEYVTAYDYQYVQNTYIKYAPPPPTADENKQTAISLLNATDWTSIADVGNPEMANPYLVNQAEFIAWRSQVRAIAVNPVDGNLDIFNQIPQEVWQ